MRQSEQEQVESIAGYRLVRRLAAGSRSTVYLAKAQVSPGSPEAGAMIETDAGKGPGSVALKVFAPGTPPVEIDAQLGALSAVTHPHVVRLADIATGPDGLPCLIMDRVNGPPLARILGTRTALLRSEATTILAPICGAVQSLHEAGYSHGLVTAGKIVVDASGAPVPLGLGRASARRGTSGEDEGWRNALLADQRSLLNLCLSVFDSLNGERGAGLVGRPDTSIAGSKSSAAAGERRQDLIDQLVNGPADSFLQSLERWLFEQAAPVPLRREELGLSPDPGNSGKARSGSVVGQTIRASASVSAALTSDWPDPIDVAATEPPIPGRGPPASLLRMLPLPDWVHEAVGPDRRRSPIRLRRRPVIACLIVTGALVVATLVLLPTGARPDVGDEAPSSQSIPLGEHVALSPVDTGEGAEPEFPAEAAAIVADDPAAALLALSARRDRCLVAKSMDCLSGVHQWQSAAGAADAALLSAVPEGEAPEFVSFDTASLTTVQRTGDSAIVAAAAANDKPAPFLLMKGEAGWRLRDVFYR